MISGEELGDQKPIQLLRRIQQLFGDILGTGTDANLFLRELFLQQLPPNVRMVLASADPSMTLDNLADMADKIMEVATPPGPSLLQIYCLLTNPLLKICRGSKV